MEKALAESNRKVQIKHLPVNNIYFYGFELSHKNPKYEKKLQKVIVSKYATLDIADDEKEKVKSVDDSLLYHEFLCYHGDKLFDFTPEIHIDVKDNSKNISETEKEFLCMYEALKIK